MSVIKFLMKIVTFLAGIMVLIGLTRNKEKDQYILLNVKDEN